MESKIIPELQALLEEVEKEYGRPVKTSKDFYILAALIEHQCREVVSSATLKRLWGYVSLQTTPRKQTLDILSRFVGYKDFSDFRASLVGKMDETSGFFDTTYLAAEDVPEGKILRIGWEPNRLLRLRRTGDISFEVIESHNSKLLAGDRFEASCFFKGLPLMIPVVVRGEENLPAFVAGRTKGLNLLGIEN